MKALKKGLLVFCLMLLPVPSAFAFGGPKGPQYVPLEKISDAKYLKKAVDDLTDDTKGKQFGKVKKIVIPSYYIEFRTTSSGKAVNKGLLGQHGVSADISLTYGNPDPAVMQAIATAALADLTERLAAAGYEVVKPADVAGLEPFKKLAPFPSGKIAESTVKQVGFSNFKSMYAAAEELPIYFDGVMQDPEAPSAPHFDGTAVSGAVWEKAGGDGVGVLRPKIVVDFVNFTSETGQKAAKDFMGNEILPDRFGNVPKSDFASISAIPQVKIYGSMLGVTRTYVKVMGNTYPDDVGSVYLKGDIELISTTTSDALGRVEDKNGQWVFTADNEKYKEVAIDLLKTYNALMVGKAKSFK